MTVSDPKLIDILSIDKDGNAVLTVSDHLPWDEPNHLITLQAKLNAYLAFVESGEIYTTYPDARNRLCRFRVVCKYPPDTKGLAFLAEAGGIIEKAGFEFSHSVFDDGSGS